MSEKSDILGSGRREGKGGGDENPLNTKVFLCNIIIVNFVIKSNSLSDIFATLHYSVFNNLIIAFEFE